LLLLFEDPHGVASEDTAAMGTGNLGPIEVIDPEIGRWKVRVYGSDVPSGSTKFHINLINQSYLLSRYNESLKAYDKAIDIDSKSIGALNNKAVILYESHKINAAIELMFSPVQI
jgi:tetratricopeptide (TPR) repeat protein